MFGQTPLIAMKDVRFQLRGFMARRFGALLERACVARLGRVASGALRPLAV